MSVSREELDGALSSIGVTMVSLGEKTDSIIERIIAHEHEIAGRFLDAYSKIEAGTARLTESERAMTTWVETQFKVLRPLLENEEKAWQELTQEFRESHTGIHHRIQIIEDGPLTIMMDVLGELQATLGRVQKDLVNVDDTLQHTEHSEDRRHVKALPTAKGYRIEASVELYGSDNHIVAQELSKLVEECRRELKEPLEEAQAKESPLE